MFLSRLVLSMTLLFALLMVSAAPSRTSKYKYKVAKREDIVRRSTRTRPLYRRASALPGQGSYAVFPGYSIAGASTTTSSSTIQPTFDSCGALCSATSDCAYFRWIQTGEGNCYLRTGTASFSENTTTRSGVKGVTCAQAKSTYPSLASATCIEEFH